MPEQSLTSSPTVLALDTATGATLLVVMVPAGLALQAGSGLASSPPACAWALACVPMCPCSCVAVLHCTPHSWQSSTPPAPVPPKPPRAPPLSFHSCPWCFWAWTRR